MRRTWIILCIKIFTDALIVNSAFILGYIIKFRAMDYLAISIYSKSLMFITILWLIIFNLAGLYKPQLNKLSRVDSVIPVSFGVFSAAFFTYTIIILLYKEASYSKEIVIIGSFISLLLVNISRYLIWIKFSK